MNIWIYSTNLLEELESKCRMLLFSMLQTQNHIWYVYNERLEINDVLLKRLQPSYISIAQTYPIQSECEF